MACSIRRRPRGPVSRSRSFVHPVSLPVRAFFLFVFFIARCVRHSLCKLADLHRTLFTDGALVLSATDGRTDEDNKKNSDVYCCISFAGIRTLGLLLAGLSYHQVNHYRGRSGHI